MVMGIFDTFKFIEELAFVRGKSSLLKEQLEILRSHLVMLTSENTALNDKIKAQQAIIDKKDEKIAATDEIIDKLKRQNADFVSQLEEFHKWPPVKFNPKTGTWVDEETQIHYCPSCKAKNIIAPLQELEHGWRCNIKVCDKFYQNPDMPGDMAYTTASISRRRQLDRYL